MDRFFSIYDYDYHSYVNEGIEKWVKLTHSTHPFIIMYTRFLLNLFTDFCRFDLCFVGYSHSILYDWFFDFHHFCFRLSHHYFIARVYRFVPNGTIIISLSLILVLGFKWLNNFASLIYCQYSKIFCFHYWKWMKENGRIELSIRWHSIHNYGWTQNPRKKLIKFHIEK